MRFSAKKLFLIGFVVLLLVGIPVTVYLVQQQQELRSRAEKSTNLSFQPDSSRGEPIIAELGQEIPLDIMIDPGQNLASFFKVEIQYDPDKLATTASSFQVNSAVFPAVLAGPEYSPGKITVSMSIGTNPSNAVQTKVRAATINLQAVGETGEQTPTLVTYGINTVVTSVGSEDQASENVLSNSTPATIRIGGTESAPTSTPRPTTGPQPTSGPAPTSGPTPTTVIGDNNSSPLCSALIADTTSGTAPFTVNFTASGSDSDGTISKVTFNFGDGEVNDVTSGGGIGTAEINVLLSHTYTTSGSFQATALLTDDVNGVSDTVNCSQNISVAGEATVATATPTIAPSGTTEVLIGLGAIATVLMVVGSLVFFAL